MQNRPVQTSSRTKISADLISNCTKIGINATNYTRLTKIGIVPNRTKISENLILRHTKIGVILVLQLIKISAILDRTKIGANTVYSSNITRIPHARANCTGRVLIRRVFNNEVIQLAIAIKAI